MKQRTLLVIILLISLVLTGCVNITINSNDAAAENKAGVNMENEAEAATVETISDLPVYALPDDEFARAMNPHRNYLIMVNDRHPYEFGGVYDTLLKDDLVYVADVLTGEQTPIERAALYAFTELQYDLSQKGMCIGLYSAYRSEADQQAVLDYYGNLEGWAETNRVSEPGFSEHHTGLLLNILILWSEGDGDKEWYTETAERQQQIPEFKVIHETLADYGFIDRYPAHKEAYTGYPCEPYEIRFVGSSKVAHEIMDNGMCLEEYLENIEE